VTLVAETGLDGELGQRDMSVGQEAGRTLDLQLAEIDADGHTEVVFESLIQMRGMNADQDREFREAHLPIRIHPDEFFHMGEPAGTSCSTSGAALAFRLAEDAPDTALDNQRRGIIGKTKLSADLLHSGSGGTPARHPELLEYVGEGTDVSRGASAESHHDATRILCPVLIRVELTGGLKDNCQRMAGKAVASERFSEDAGQGHGEAGVGVVVTGKITAGGMDGFGEERITEVHPAHDPAECHWRMHSPLTSPPGYHTGTSLSGTDAMSIVKEQRNDESRGSAHIRAPQNLLPNLRTNREQEDPNKGQNGLRARA
jgi:hypothetical protein